MTTAKPADAGHRGATKVPEITVLFWVIKVLTTGVGETTSDFLAHTVDPVIAVGLAAAALAVSLTLQFRAHGYSPVRYWTTVLLVSVFGTMPPTSRTSRSACPTRCRRRSSRSCSP
ncbi:hypothetical protein ABZU76_45050 [Amycolatopsis sp. NPDC005232]|uniref:hypothetical protein n=1 Tax=Amycolatopsis sp. NPDC005232 TaxID=3157027 RepID=UPI0033B6B755